MSTMLFEGTGTVTDKPQIINLDGEDTMTCYVECHRLTMDAQGQKLVQTMYVFLRYQGRNKDEFCERLSAGSRVAFSGEIIGNEKGNPFIVQDPSTKELFTRFDTKVYSLRYQGRLAEGEEAEDLVTLLIVGYLGKKVEMRYTKEGQPVANTSIATNYRVKIGENQYKELPVWWRVTAWGKTAEGMNRNRQDGNPLLGVGSSVVIKGSPDFDPETGGPKMYDTRDGGKGASYELTVFSWQFAGGKSDSAPANLPAQQVDPDADLNDL